MNNSRRVNSITYGALLTALLGVLLFLNRQMAGALDLYMFWIIPIPVIIYILKFGVSQSFVLGISMMLITFILATPATVFRVAGAVIAGIIYGYGMTKHWSGTKLIISVIIISLIMMVFSLFLFSSVFGYDLQEEVIWYRETMNQMIEQIGQGNSDALKSAMASMLSDKILLTIIIFSEILASILEGIMVHLLAYVMLRRLKMELPPMKPLGEITAPKWLKVAVFTALSAFVLATVTGVSQYDNLIILSLSLVYAVCMLYGYLLIVTYVSWKFPRKGSRAVAIMIAVMAAFFFPPLMYIVGLIDIYTDTRHRIIEELKKNGETNRKS
ncbi:MAG: DUF2232 domain-containing protein [Erysipelotrichaceae bacterium]|nr:DUF2232 domain-containing protein [Erysipelotrichaceae bacterium]